MNEVFEKIIARLEENIVNADLECASWKDKTSVLFRCADARRMTFVDTIEIIKQVVKEYNNDTINQIAEMYASCLTKYGVDVTEKWETAIQNTYAMEQAYMRGRQDEIDKFAKFRDEYDKDINVSSNDRWIPFTERKTDEDEKEAYGCDIMLSCKLPEEDEEILVTYRNGYVDTDTFLRDGYECYLDSGAEFVTEAVAWMPKPKGYQPIGD
jgi:hypothetical protein